jgi:hypothetical protein
MAGQDHLLSKAFLCTGAAAYVFGQCVTSAAGSALDPNQMIQVTAGGGSAFAVSPLGLVQENIDLVKVTTLKAYASVAISGIAYGIYNTGTLTLGTPLIPSVAVAGRLDAVTASAAGRPQVGYYLGDAGGAAGTGSAAGDIIAVMLTPGARC